MEVVTYIRIVTYGTKLYRLLPWSRDLATTGLNVRIRFDDSVRLLAPFNEQAPSITIDLQLSAPRSR